MKFGQFLDLLYSFRGRINRQQYWIGFACLIAIILALVAPFIAGLDKQLNIPQEAAIAYFAVIGTLLGFVPGMALNVKRLHDREKSAWWLLPFILVPAWLDKMSDKTPEGTGPWWFAVVVSFLLGVWALVELGFCRGTQGPNAYGEDPLASVYRQPTTSS